MTPCRPEQGHTGRTVVQIEASVAQAKRGRTFGRPQAAGRSEPDDESVHGLRVKHLGGPKHHTIEEGNLREEEATTLH